MGAPGRRFLAIVAMLAAWGAWGYAVMRSAVAPGIRQGQPAPAFTLPDLSGRRISLADFAGRPVLIRFSSRTCSFCSDDFAILEDLQARLGQRLQVIAIQVEDDPQWVTRALGGRRPSYPVLIDRTGEVARAYQVKGLPMLYFVTRSGLLSSAARGEIADVDIRPHLEEILGGSLSVAREVEVISRRLRCQQCQGLSVWDSNAESAWEMREQIREMVLAGKSREEIIQWFVDRYGPWILMSPPARGFFLLAWVVPGLAALAGAALLARHWRRVRAAEPPAAVPPPELSEEERARLDRRLEEYL